MAKKIVIDTDRVKGKLFKVSEFNGRHHIYDIEVRSFSNKEWKIGEASSLQDALEVIKSYVKVTVRGMRIKDW